jgi:spore germination protein GerM
MYPATTAAQLVWTFAWPAGTAKASGRLSPVNPLALHAMPPGSGQPPPSSMAGRSAQAGLVDVADPTHPGTLYWHARYTDI